MQSGRDNFRYLNREGKWLDFHWSGLELTPQGALQLVSAPRLVEEHISDSTTAAPPEAPSGIAVDHTGRVFYSLPDANCIMSVGGCDPVLRPLACITESAGLGSLTAPRGLLALKDPERLVIVDSGNDRLLFCDLRDFDLREVWGQADLGSLPSPCDAPDRFNDPWSVAADDDGKNIYVLDAGSQRILKFARTGEPDVDFLERIQHSGLAPYPSALTVKGSGTNTRLFVGDFAASSIFVFDQSGAPILDGHGSPVVIRRQGMGGVLALARNATHLFVGDNDGKRILSFLLADGFPFSGEAAGFRGYVTALAIDSESGNLLAQTGDSAQPLSLESSGAYLNSGVLWSEPIPGGASTVDWNRLEASVANVPGSHVEFYYAISDAPARVPVDPAAKDPFRDEGWNELPKDTEDFLLVGNRGHYLSVGARFSSDGVGTPHLTQMRADFDTESYMRYLPSIYREIRDDDAILHGVVKGADGAGVSGAVVSIINERTNELRETLTDNQGLYIFSRVSPERYTVKVAMTGFKTAQQTGVGLAARRSSRLHISLEPGSPGVFVILNAKVFQTEIKNFETRLVGMFQSLFEDIEEEVDSLERYFDPYAAPPEALEWLATWLAVDLDQGEPVARMRDSIASAFHRYQWRGTIEGLRLALLEDAGIHAIISEPISATSFWAMPKEAGCGGSKAATSPQLGLGTHLPSMEPGGAVLGQTAALDHSYLITDAEFGEPLFAGAAWQFVVEVFRSEADTDARLKLLIDIIEREKPAQTMYRLELIDSTMRAGFQSRVGVDTVVGGSPGPTPLGVSGGFGLRFGGPVSPRIGTSRLGQDIRL